MEKSTKQVEKNVSASFAYVKKDMLMLNDAFSDLHDKVQHLSLNHAMLLEQITELKRRFPKTASKKKEYKKKVTKKTTKTKKDDLTKIEGIGPAIKKFLWKNKIETFKKLGNKAPEELRETLGKGGTKLQMHNPSTWPRQARLATNKEWKELKKLKERLVGGVFEKKK